MNKKFLSITLASIISLNAFSTNIFLKTTHAEITFKSNVTKIEGPVAGGENDEWKGNYIYFGRYPQTLKNGKDSSSTDPNDFEIEPIKWRVLDPANSAWDDSKSIKENGFAYNIGYADDETDTTKGGCQNAPVGGNGILLYSDIALDAKQYHPTYNNVNEENELCWGGDGGGSGKGCTLWAWLNGYENGSVLGNASVPDADTPFLTNAFSSAEQNVIMSTKVYSEDLYSDRTGATDPNRKRASSPRTSLTKDKIFVPSYNEMLNTSYGFTSTYSSSNTRSFQSSNYSNSLKRYSYSWLRSPGDDLCAQAANLTSSGYVHYRDNVDNHFKVCPALNLNLTSVILVSETIKSGGKKSTVVSSTPARFELPTGTGNEYKLTLHDESRDNFTANKTVQNENEITISYSNAKTGENEYISCMILDDTSEIKYYGKLKQVDAESGETTLILPENLEAGKIVNVVIFNEQCNGSYETDWSSMPKGFEVTVEKVDEPLKNPSDDKSLSESEIKIDFSYNESMKDEPNKNEDETNSSKKTIVEISDGETKKVEYEDGTANITAKKSDDILEIEIKDEDGNDLNIKDKVNLLVPCDDCKPETVAAEVKSDGTHKIIRDSVAKNDNICIPLNKSTKLEVINNGKNFDDVSVNHWASDSVAFTSAHELFIGTETNIFEPELPISRSMFTQVLHNFENNPNQIYENIFDDVEPTDWFSKPVIWAAKHNATVIGYGDGNFGPNDNITREQLATILYRYFGENEIVDIDLNFADANQINDYALKAMKWAVKYKIIQGEGNNILDPKGLATRAEVAQMFHNLMLNLFYR